MKTPQTLEPQVVIVKILSVNFENSDQKQVGFSGDPIFLKRNIISFDLLEPVRQVIESASDNGLVTPVESLNCATPIVTSLKTDNRTPRICGNYQLTSSSPVLSLLSWWCFHQPPEICF